MSSKIDSMANDVEDGGYRWKSDNRVHHELEITEAAGMFLIWSMLVTVEGTIRLVANANPEGGLAPDGVFPPAALLAGGIAECIFGFAGLVLGVYVLMFKLRKSGAGLMLGFLAMQSLLGWFVFITFVLANPLYSLVNAEMGRFGFSLGLDRFLMVLGVLSSISWCAALQSGQFVLAFRMYKMITGHRDTLKMHKLRAVVWCALAAMAAVAMTITGAVVLARADGSTPFIPPPAYPPHVNIYPISLVITGIITLAWTLLGLMGAMSASKAMLNAFHGGWAFVFFANLITFCWLYGKIGIAAPAAQHCVLSFAYLTLPVVFTRKIYEWQESYAENLE